MSRNDRDRQFMRASADKFSATIREAQNSALTGDMVQGQRPCSFSVITTGLTYEVNARTYDPSDFTQSCASASDQTSLIPVTPFDRGVSLSAHPGTLTFGNQFADITDGISSGSSVQYLLENSSFQYTVCVFRSGRVENRGFGDLSC